MNNWNSFVRGLNTGGHPEITLGSWTGVTRFDEPEREYEAAQSRAALHDRSYRGLLDISGADRAAWLHNLTTNDVKALKPGFGHYAFAVNVQGRILFDMNVLALPDCLRVDIDRRWIDTALAHFAKYTIVEDVTVSDRSDKFVRLALTGPEASSLLATLGAPSVTGFAPLQHGRLNDGGGETEFFRHDVDGGVGVELLVPADRAPSVWRALADFDAAKPVGYDVLNIRRIERGIAWPITEITNETLPPETNQFERAVNIHKGCYLGQEVVERMRSRGSVARKLVLIRFEGDRLPPDGAEILNGEERVGRITSVCRSPGYQAPLALAYVRTAHTPIGTRLSAEDGNELISGEIVTPNVIEN